mmetsp:Transcript_100772/g.300575  ORF Transcript_100772/g.300575 Transcript_100772/m.300575 type:complete len:275 (-) Transcript_100772:344-1168(-)
MTSHNEPIVIDTKVYGPRNLNVCEAHLLPARHVVLRRSAGLWCVHGLDVENHKLREVGPRADRRTQGPLPVLGRGDIVAPQRQGVNEADAVGDLVAEHHRRGSAESRGVASGYVNDVVCAHWAQVKEDCVLVVVGVAVCVVRHEVLGVLLLGRHAARDEVGEALRVTPLPEVEVQSLARLLERQDFVMRVTLENELLEVAERSSVRDLLPDLDNSIPRVRSEGLLAVLALLIDDLELHDHRLLQDAGGGDLLLHGDLYPNALGVLLRPDEGRIN